MTSQRQGVKVANPHDAFDKHPDPKTEHGQLRCPACPERWPANAGGHLSYIGHWYTQLRARLNR